LYDFGDQNAQGLGRQYVMMTPHSGAGDHRISITDSDVGNINETAVTGAGVLDNRGLMQVVGVYDTASGVLSLYTNGVLDVTTTSTVRLEDVKNVNSWIGRAMFNGDAYLNASITEFRIYNAALSASQVAASYAAGIDGQGPVAFTRPLPGKQVFEGGPVVLTADLRGEAPLTINWYRNGELIAEAIGGVYTIPAASMADNGAQFVCVASNWFQGSSFVATSSVAVVTVQRVERPTLPVATWQGGNVQFSIATEVGRTYSLEYTLEILPLDWQPLGTPVSGTGNPEVLADIAPTNQHKYYRLKIQ
jgi:hypothetical protein